MTVLSISRRRRGDRLVVVAHGTLTLAQVPELVPFGALPRGIEQVEIRLFGVRFDVGAMAALARLASEAPVPVYVTPSQVRHAVEAAAGVAFVREMNLATGGGRTIGLCIVDPTGKVRFANATAHGALGLTPPVENVLWKDVRPAGRDPVREALARRALAQFRRKDGWLVEAVPLATGGAVVSLIPPDEPVRAAEEQNDALAQVAAAAAHEIRNPLAAIRAAVQLLHGKLADTAHTETLNVVLTEIDRLASLLDHYLLLSRPTVRREVELTSVVDSSLFFLKQDVRSDGVNVRRSFGASGARVLADPDKLREVLVGLLTNALDALDGDGEISVDVVGEPGSGEASVIIRDSGPGFPAAVLAAPFETFRTSKPGASGLGLVIAQEVVTAHGGRLRLTNGPGGRGAQVAVTLPTLPPV